MSTETTSTTREQLKDLSQEEFLKAHTRDAMNSFASELGLTDEQIKDASTKADLYTLLIDAANLPDPALRGTSTVDSPVALTWNIADRMFAEARANDEPNPRRKDVIAAAMEAGVTFYTARTQYQSWFTHTSKGAKLMADGNTDGIPQAVSEARED